ncbi:hypothetical protein C8R43DRAFT_1111364 [Mycena crocata]|nr:hypothetical protein C8R43DRAFT_1111364 [Mycena crocata]
MESREQEVSAVALMLIMGSSGESLIQLRYNWEGSRRRHRCKGERNKGAPTRDSCRQLRHSAPSTSRFHEQSTLACRTFLSNTQQRYSVLVEHQRTTEKNMDKNERHVVSQSQTGQKSPVPRMCCLARHADERAGRLIEFARLTKEQMARALRVANKRAKCAEECAQRAEDLLVLAARVWYGKEHRRSSSIMSSQSDVTVQTTAVADLGVVVGMTFSPDGPHRIPDKCSR